MSERPAWHADPVIEDRVFRLVDLTEEPIPTIKDRTFVRCAINGPAVIIPMECNFDHPIFQAGDDPEAILWEIRPVQTKLIGAIGLVGCRFKDCQFIGIGIAGNAAMLEQVRRSIRGGSGGSGASGGEGFSPFEPGTWGGDEGKA